MTYYIMKDEEEDMLKLSKIIAIKYLKKYKTNFMYKTQFKFL